MITVAGGDSFIFGTELKDQFTGRPSKSTFTALLSYYNGTHYQCVAEPGASNSEITRRVLDYCEHHKDLDKLVIVQWTFPNRYEFRFDTHWRSVNVWNIQENDDIKSQLKTFSQKTIDDNVIHNNELKELGVIDFIKDFYKQVGQYEYWEVYTSLKEIVQLQNYLKLNYIPYIFMFADDSLLDNYTINSKETSIQSLYNQIDFDNFFEFPKYKGFYQWALENKYPIGATHPLEQAHYDAAQLLKDRFHELVKKSNEPN